MINSSVPTREAAHQTVTDFIKLQTPSYHALVWFWFPAIGFFSGVFGLFTMYLPPLFPTLLRTTGAGFCFNIGRIAAAFGTVYFGRYAHLGDFRHALLYAGFLFVPAMIVALLLPEHEPTSYPSYSASKTISC